MKNKLLLLAFALAVPIASSPAQTPKQETAREQAYRNEMLKLERQLDKQSGTITLPAAKAKLTLGDQYYFVPAKDAAIVLEKMWGNPPEVSKDVLGIVFEKNATAYDAVWGAVLTFDPTGYVSDADAKSEDYNAVLNQMREGQDERNAERRKAGYPGMQLIGWAQNPIYDARQHSLIWARELKVDGVPVNSLNYDVRLLGREGVLSMNMISDMRHLADVQRAAKAFGGAASFNPGATYADYNAATDKSAGYGLAGLVAGGAGLAVAKKLGLLGIILAFGKKFIVLIGLAFAAIGRLLWGMIGRKSRDPETI